MLAELRITDLGVISEATLDLDPGLTVVTGETGAGKTMIVSGIALLLGSRADAGAVRTGAERARIEGVFRLPQRSAAVGEAVAEAGGSVEDDELLVARHLTAAGRSRAYLGGAQVPAATCGDLVAELVTVHGQSEQVRLGRSDRQREILDRFAGPKLATVLTSYGVDYTERRRTAAELDELRRSAQRRAREIDLLRFGLEEIGAVQPQPGEDETLAAEASRLQAADDLQIAATTAMVAIAGDEDDPNASLGAADALSAIGIARKAAEQLAGLDADAAGLSQRIAEVGYLLSDLAGDLSRYLAGLESSPGRLEEVAARRSQLAQLTRKYGTTVDEVLAWSADADRQLGELETGDERIEELQVRLAELDTRLADQAGSITRLRTTAARRLSRLVLAELAALAMPHARLEFAIAPTEPGPYGRDQVELLFSANPGTEPRNLARVASGGELSRVRLALEVVLAGDDAGGTFVFDEVDAGVGGKVAVEIGRRLAALARHSQVIVVTHLAQVAAFADRHYVVAKADDGQVTTSGVSRVTNAERAAELARMMAGLDKTESSIAHAEELLELASRAAPGRRS
ncbi:DNA repair protein RecN [Microlunatus sp. Gsoil 973]|uniref:DNA repair protein RecN n=1 Tax=Microlunatus sp. Gsoil 973 TaxID=2672569 RepID=UPI0012B4AC78|nr:DNA repair protein RecN [Microlunatus sp. Gsoil 973]QGN33158.1 DNA repair protein RecN [Microlunatus sp. Gsoil 973]